ncbi:hypothetical protein H257_03836 [Aphanomyces astaci]|uniref:Histone-lysine N-methyltransferase, H3 lysine-79 specific n=1 Tax=Aphanomyces astaci TaxID=112090 RepID=W4H0D6_APHAT|nr:hypothetical protein H257_03836 [Aphanomyces astaci]ETV84729.1 hypothetical protein H257_03836 [Aphanomyces astaci]|eukprot:XP_009826421.1 hypothetical protein H257_03836 [Aphanomyces astaci]
MTDAVQTWKAQLVECDPTSDQWKEAAQHMREYAADFVNGLKRRPNSRAVDEVRALIPDDLREELEALPVAQFALGLIFYRPFQDYNRVYRHFSHEYAKELSMQARKDFSEFDTTSFVYGEISFFPFADILDSISADIPVGNGVFYDLGSGVGKAVMAAALVHKFHKAIGIEQLKPLVDFSHARVDRLMETNDVAGQTISYLCGSFFDHKWSDGDVVFCHSTCFSPRYVFVISLPMVGCLDTKDMMDSMWERISKDAEQLKQGAYFISVSHILASPLFEVLRTLTVQMGWGNCTVYIQRRRRIGRWASKMLKGSATRTDLQRPNTKQSELRE